MTTGWLLLAGLVLACPAPRPAAGRLRRLADAGRLAGRARTGRRPPLGVPSTRGPLACLACALLAGTPATVLGGPALGVAAAAISATVASSGLRSYRRRRERRARDDLALALHVLAGELEIGSRPDEAFAAAAEVAPLHRSALVAASAAAGRGEDLGAALSGAQLRPLAVVWQVVSVTGAAPGTVIRRLHDDLQAQLVAGRDVAAALAGPRSSAVLLAALPALGVVLGSVMGARPLDVLFGSAAGRGLLCLGVLLDVLGVAWTTRLISTAEGS